MSDITIKKAINSCCHKVMKKQNVVGMARGTKISNNIDTSEECITIFVSEKLSEDDLNDEDIIPKQVENIKTDVIEIGDVRPTSLVARIRPVEPGYCISPVNVSYSGTFGCIVEDKNNKYILSNNHVLANNNTVPLQTKILQPSRPFGGKEENDVIAELAKFSEIKFNDGSMNIMDAAIARIINEEDVTSISSSLGQIEGINLRPEVGDIVKKSGMTSELGFGQILYTDAIISINYEEDKVATFGHQIITTGMLRPGDSGSLIVDYNNYAVALGFAGSDTISIVSPINPILKEFGVILV